MKISIITAVRNNRAFIESCIGSVGSQTYPRIEHIIIDGASTDGTLDIVRQMLGARRQASGDALTGQQSGDSEEKSMDTSRFASHTSRVISEPDAGIYDALNKGISMATGDVIGFLHGDDIYAHDRVIERVAAEMEAAGADSCYGDLLYVDRSDTRRVIRRWKSQPFTPELLQKGWMPPHPTFFVRREAYERYGLFDTSFRIAADYEMILRLLGRARISTHYIPEVLIKMRLGGESNRSIPNMLRKSREDLRAMRMHRMGGAASLLMKNISKLSQFRGP